MTKNDYLEEYIEDKDFHFEDHLLKIRQLIDKKIPREIKKHFSHFTEILFTSYSPLFIREFTPQQFLALAQQQFNFISNCNEKGIVLSVTQPNFVAPVPYRSVIFIEIFMEDRPFIVDSIEEYLIENHYKIVQLLHPIVTVQFSENNQLSLLRTKEEQDKDSCSYVCCIVEIIESQNLEKIEQDFREILSMVEYATGDYTKVSHLLGDLAQVKNNTPESLRESEVRQLFTWLNSGSTVLLGGGWVYTHDVEKGINWKNIHQPLGYIRFRKEQKCTECPKEIGKLIAHFLQTGLQVNLIEMDDISLVHRREKILLLIGKKTNEENKPQIYFFPLLFTDKSHKENALAIPLARLKVNSIVESKKFFPNSYSYKEALDFFNYLPKSELFRLDRKELTVLLEQTEFAWERRNAKAFVYTEPERQYARISFCIPIHGFNQDVFEKIREIFHQKLDFTKDIAYWLPFGRNVYIHYVFWFRTDLSEFDKLDIPHLENLAVQLTRSWESGLLDELYALETKSSPQLLYQKYSSVFPLDYQALFLPSEAITDIVQLEKLLSEGRVQVALKPGTTKDRLVVAIYSKQKYLLAEMMPSLQNLSLSVIDVNAFELDIADQKAYIYDFRVVHRPLSSKDNAYRKNFQELLQAVLEGQTENDPLNGLLTVAGQNMKEINLFLLYRNYYWQIRSPYSKFTISKSFLENPLIISALRDYFVKKFQSPDAISDENYLDAEKQKVLRAISTVETVTEDVIFRNIFNFMEATVRSNFLCLKKGCVPAIKVKSTLVEHMPLPRPFFEIFVYGPDLEGIHLRGGNIARGGLRHSDRHDDYRTEVLGLMKTQMLKNTVIVPVGSKGGFITKRVQTNRQAAMEEAKKQYQVYIRSLLSLTDNIVEGKVVPPEKVVRYDGDDPYLVVAADKGTAHLSDTANAISKEENFWLGDAFASGGSVGYDHKAMGITARGAWESVKIHFLEMGKDILTENFSVIGIGDMAGDVFGNGMLRSRNIQLKAAFNHAHIFVDPQPDPEKSFQERERLFQKPGSSWMDYNKKLISKGGGIFERKAKEVELSPEINKFLGVTNGKVSGEELIRLILQTDVDLLWNGGIGTYVKASTETALQVGDQTNDSVRVDANQLKVKVIGEGGNLGLTQQARIEYASLGGRLNTDAIDNSAGVDVSDHEVNIKILLNEFIRLKKLTAGNERNALLFALTESVAELCLNDNRQQSLIISMDQKRSMAEIGSFLDIIQFLAEKKLLDRRTENIPNNTLINRFFNTGVGMPRPVLAVILSYVKMYFFNEMIKSNFLTHPLLDRYFVEYFPEKIQREFPLDQVNHRLKNEIIATMLVNRTVNQAGVTFLPKILSLTQVDPVRIILAYTVVDNLLELPQLRKELLEELEGIKLKMAYPFLIDIEELTINLVSWLLVNIKEDDGLLNMMEEFSVAMAEYSTLVMDDELFPEGNRLYSARLAALAGKALSSKMMEKLAHLVILEESLDVIYCSRENRIPISDQLVLNGAINRVFHFPILQKKIRGIKPETKWVQKHQGVLIKQLYQQKRRITENMIHFSPSLVEIKGKINTFFKEHEERITAYQNEYHNYIQAESDGMEGLAVLTDFLNQI